MWDQEAGSYVRSVRVGEKWGASGCRSCARWVMLTGGSRVSERERELRWPLHQVRPTRIRSGVPIHFLKAPAGLG